MHNPKDSESATLIPEDAKIISDAGLWYTDAFKKIVDYGNRNLVAAMKDQGFA